MTSAMRAEKAETAGRRESSRRRAGLARNSPSGRPMPTKTTVSSPKTIRSCGRPTSSRRACPRNSGGAGAEVAELAEMLRELAHHCSSTALAFSMHTHQVAIPAWRWRHQKVGGGRTAAATRGGGKAGASVERRLRLDRRFRQGGESRWRLPGVGAKGFHLRRRRRRHPDDRRRRAIGNGTGRGHPFSGVDEGAGGEDTRHLAHPWHARHRLRTTCSSKGCSCRTRALP